MNTKSLLTFMLVLAGFSMAKAETVLIGDGGTSSTSGLPSAVNWKYSMSQQIYTVAEIGKTGTITSIAFKPVKGPAQARTLKVYMVETSKSSFSSKNDWIPFSESDRVFSGSVDLVIGEWATLPIGRRFNYSGTGNLCVITIDETGSFIQNTSIDWLAYSASNQSNYRYNDNSPYDPSSLTFSETGNFKNYKNQIQLAFEDTEIVEVGRDDFSLHLLPTVTSNKYSLTQQIYTKEEIGREGTITSIAFYNADPYTDLTRNIYLYLTRTSQTSFGGGKWIPVSESFKVFSGSVTFRHDCWTTIYFNMPFYYDGTSNLAVIMNDITGSAQSQIEFSVYNTNKQYHAIYASSGNTIYDPENPPSENWTCSYAKNCIQLGFRKMETVEIGEGEDLYCQPIVSSYASSYSQQIYTKDEIGRTGSIASIAFYNDRTDEIDRYIYIYLKHTSKDSFSSGEIIEVSGKDNVFNGGVTFKEPGWTTIYFDTPFFYDGKNNLAVTVTDQTGCGASNEPLLFRVFPSNCSSHQSCIAWSDTQCFNPYDPSTIFPGFPEGKNCIRLGFIGDSGSDPDPGLITKTVQIGNAETKDYYLPVNTYYNYSLTQQIYTAAEIGTAGTITSIAFDYAHSAALSMSGVQMYMKNVSKSKFDSRSDMVSVSASDLVWEGTLSASEAGWVTIKLNKPFKYDGKSNLLVCLYDPTNGYPGSSYTFKYTETEQNSTLAYWSDSNVPDLGSLTSFSGSAEMKKYHSNIKLYIQATGSGPGLDYIDFETGDFSQFKFQNDSDYPWIVTNATAADGTYCMKSGNGGVASSSSTIAATRTYEENGYVCFDAKCMGEGTAWDVCSFYIDGEVQFSYGALGNYWAFYYYPVTAGSHTFKWEYKKDSSTNPEGDAFFVDNIRFLEEGRDDDLIVGVKDLKDFKDLKDLKDLNIYNLAGQRLFKMQKGINIVNGKKVLVK